MTRELTIRSREVAWRDLKCRYGREGRTKRNRRFVAMENNAERPCAIGRKNWLFCGNDGGGRTAAVLFSMTSTAKRHNLDPFAWLRDVLRTLPTLTAAPTDDQLQPLLPGIGT